MDIIEAARNLGVAMQKDERYIAFAKVKLDVDKDKTLQDNIGKFNITKMNLDSLMDEENKDENKINELNTELRKIYIEIMDNPTMKAFNEAKGGVDHMLHDINTIIMKSADGEDPMTCEYHEETCGGNCSSCAGCH